MNDRRKLDQFLLVILTASLALNVYLGLRVGQAPTTATRPTLAVGAVVPPIEGKLVNGASVKLLDKSRPTVVYVFSPTCVWCERNTDNLTAILSAGRGKVNFVGISLSPDVKDYLASRPMPGMEIIVEPSPATLRSYLLASTPQTIVVAPNGEVLKNWLGAFTGGTGKEVESYFGTTLPGLVGTTGDVKKGG